MEYINTALLNYWNSVWELAETLALLNNKNAALLKYIEPPGFAPSEICGIRHIADLERGGCHRNPQPISGARYRFSADTW